MLHDARPSPASSLLRFQRRRFQSPCNLQTWSMISWLPLVVNELRDSTTQHIGDYPLVISYSHWIFAVYSEFSQSGDIPQLCKGLPEGTTLLNGVPPLLWPRPLRLGTRARQMGHVPPASWSFLAQPKQVLWWHLATKRAGSLDRWPMEHHICATVVLIHSVYVMWCDVL